MLNFNNIQIGDAIPAHSIALDKERYFAYNALIGEINPLHFNDNYAKKMGFKAPVVAGVFTYAFIPRLIENWAGKPGACSRIEIRYIAPAYIDDKIKTLGSVTKKYTKDGANFVECDLRIETEDGGLILEADVTAKL